MAALAALAFLLRLPTAGIPLSVDESGFLLIGGQWHPGTSLYGDYWVDRPPVLLGLFGLAEVLGGAVPLRILAALGVAVTVLAVGMASRRAGGAASGVAAAAVTLGLLISPTGGAQRVNGELAAAPFTALGVWLVVRAVGSTAWLPWLGAGACTAVAVLVKQNMADLAVFAAAAALLSWWQQGRMVTHLLRTAVAFLVGLVTTSAAVLGVAFWRGTGPREIFFAMYGFRARALEVMSHSHTPGRSGRLGALLQAELLTMAPVVLVALVVVLLWRRGRVPADVLVVAVATLAMTAFAILSMALGGSYWTHYLVELAVPVGLAAGVVTALVRRWVVVLVVAPVVLASLFSWGTGLATAVRDPAEVVGTAIAHASRPGDTIVTVQFAPQAVRASGLRSPYPYLFNLPARTLDPHRRRLSKLLRGPHPPTWLVARLPAGLRTVSREGVHGIRKRYRLASEICDHRIYVRVGVVRPRPQAERSCTR